MSQLAPLTPLVLQAYYETVQPLRLYLQEILRPEDAHILQEDRECFAGQCMASSPLMPMREVIDRAMMILFKKGKGKPTNVLTSGYRLKTNVGSKGNSWGRPGVENYFVNTLVTALQSPFWERLFQTIGVDAMLHLLTETSIFVALPNDCLCQMTGSPLIYAKPPQVPLNLGRSTESGLTTPTKPPKRKGNEDLHSGRLSKRQKIRKSSSLDSALSAEGGQVSQPAQERRTPADIAFARARMFYARPVHVPGASEHLVGLPPNHILHRLNPSFHRKPKPAPGEYTDPDPKEQAEGARQLSKYVFPREYGLTNVFTPDLAARPAAYQYPVWADRNEEIKARGSCKTPKRVKPVLDLLEKLLWRHGKCGYKPLRDMACPSKIKTERSQALDSTVILEMMSEYSIQLWSQRPGVDFSIDSGEPSVNIHSSSQVEREVNQKPRFAEFACPPGEVFRFAVLVVDSVIPPKLWGPSANYKLIKKHIKTFVTSRRFETLTLHNVLQEFSITDCTWLCPPGSATNKGQTPVSDALKRRALLEEFLFWFFDSFLLQLLKTNFYITESSAFRNQVLYFRQDDWQTLCRPLIDRLTTGTFRKLTHDDAQEMLRQRKLGFSFIRLLPKDTGVRPIVNLRRRKNNEPAAFGRPAQSINQVLQAAFQILTYKKKTQPELLGASVFGANETYAKLKSFKQRLLSASANGKMPKLYFAKVDVQACFDTIEQSRLLQILREMLTEEAYMIQRYGQVVPAPGKIRRMFNKQAMSEFEHPDFLSYAAELAGTLRHTIFVDQVVYAYAKKKEILELLEEHITENLVKIGSDYYQQVVGIPQGSVLSSLLCSFFYGNLERNQLKFTDSPDTVLLRLIDDYLLVTTDVSKAHKFLDMMDQGFPEYGCSTSKDKTLANFDHAASIMNVILPHQKNFPWCGYLVNMEDLSISTDYSRFKSSYLEDSLTVEKGRRPGQAFVQKTLLMAKHRSHIIFSDAELNPSDVVYKNIYQNFLVSAMKIHRYLRAWSVSPAEKWVFVLNTIHRMIEYTYVAIRSRASTSTSLANGGSVDIRQRSVTWLGTHAFHTVLSRKPTAYKKICQALAAELDTKSYKKQRHRFPVLTRESHALIAQLAF